MTGGGEVTHGITPGAGRVSALALHKINQTENYSIKFRTLLKDIAKQTCHEPKRVTHRTPDSPKNAYNTYRTA